MGRWLKGLGWLKEMRENGDGVGSGEGAVG
jgi:hypothetical protein